MSEQELQPQGMMRRYAFWILLSVELLLSFSFFGYFHIEPISVTIAYIPVLLAGALIGPLESVAVGALFGLASMWKASANYVMPADQLFSPFYSGEPLGSFMLSVGSPHALRAGIGPALYGRAAAEVPGDMGGRRVVPGEDHTLPAGYTAPWRCFSPIWATTRSAR